MTRALNVGISEVIDEGLLIINKQQISFNTVKDGRFKGK
jgi:hypothetical protein